MGVSLKTLQVVADDQTEVASKIETCMDTYEVTHDRLVRVLIAPFGGQKFLGLIVYHGAPGQAKTALIGARLTRAFRYRALRPQTNSVALTLSRAFKYVARRSATSNLGLALSRAFKYVALRPQTSNLGLAIPAMQEGAEDGKCSWVFTDNSP